MTRPKTKAPAPAGLPCAVCGLPGLVYRPLAFRVGDEVKNFWALGCLYCKTSVRCGKPWPLAA